MVLSIYVKVLDNKRRRLRMDKNQRHAIIKRIIDENQITKQSDLIELLINEGVLVTQATISRDIRELNIVKSPNSDGQVCYRILAQGNRPTKIRSDEERLKHALEDSAVSLTQIEFINLLNVLPGNGQVIGVLIDNIREDVTEIVGCLAGDDTVLILSKTKEDATHINDYLTQFLVHG